MDFLVTPKQIAAMVFWQNSLKSISMVAWGFVADRQSRKMLLSRSCLVWGALTLLVAISSGFTQLSVLRVASVVALAIMMPLSQVRCGSAARASALGLTARARAVVAPGNAL
jgi:MFS family permease